MGKNEAVEFVEDALEDPFRAFVRPIWNGMFATENNIAMLSWAGLFVMSGFLLFGSKWVMQPVVSVLLFLPWMALLFVPLYRSQEQERVRAWPFNLLGLASTICVGASICQSQTPGAVYLGALAAFVLGKLFLAQIPWSALVFFALMWSLVSWAVAKNFTDWSRMADVTFWVAGMLVILLVVFLANRRSQ